MKSLEIILKTLCLIKLIFFISALNKDMPLKKKRIKIILEFNIEGEYSI